MPSNNLPQMSIRAKGLESRILDAGGRRIASCDGPNGSALDFYSLGKQVIIVQDFADNQGVEMFTSSTHMQTGQLYEDIEKIAKA